jgi:N-carbamoylputrescine amidase
LRTWRTGARSPLRGDLRVKLAIVQFKPRKGDLRANFAELEAVFAQLAPVVPAYDLVVLPEAAMTGYFLEGGVYELAFTAADFAAKLAETWRAARGSLPVDLVAGFYENVEGTYYNAALYVRVEADGHRIEHVHRKMFLPTYGVFDEERFLSRGHRLHAFDTRFGRMAMLICEDAWHALMPTLAAIKGARTLIVPSASPGRGFSAGGELESVQHWRSVLRSYAVEHGVFIIYAGLAGFEGGKGMTGSSSAIDPFGETLVTAPALGAHVLSVELDYADIDVARARLPLLGDLGAVLPDLLAAGAVL